MLGSIVINPRSLFPKVVWTSGRLRVVQVAYPYDGIDLVNVGNKVEYNHGPNNMGQDIWLEVDYKDVDMLWPVICEVALIPDRLGTTVTV